MEKITQKQQTWLADIGIGKYKKFTSCCSVFSNYTEEIIKINVVRKQYVSKKFVTTTLLCSMQYAHENE